jgi:hypothetical protein
LVAFGQGAIDDIGMTMEKAVHTDTCEKRHAMERPWL